MSIKIYTNTFVWKWYDEWRARGGVMPPLLNLCHFVRVLVIWAPMRWFFCKNRRGGRFFDMPGLVITLLSTVGGLVIAAIITDLQTTGMVAVVALVLMGIGKLTKISSKMDLKKSWKMIVTEPLRLYRDHKAAKIGRFCPRIHVSPPSGEQESKKG